MASEEDRLDQLLKAAQQQMAGIEQGRTKQTATVTPKVQNTPENTGIAEEDPAAPASFDVPQAVQDEIFSESAPDISSDNDLFGEEYQPSTENFPMKIFDEIPEEIYRKTIMVDEPEEAVAEMPVADLPEEPEIPDVTTDDTPIVNASPFGGTSAPVVDDDPNKMMSPDDIAALVASMGGGEEVPVEEAPVEEPAAPVVDDDPNKMMSPDDIAALVASMGGGEEAPAEEAPVEEDVSEEVRPASEPSAGLDEDDPYKSMSQEEINALMGMDGDAGSNAPTGTDDAESASKAERSENEDVADLLEGGWDLREAPAGNTDIGAMGNLGIDDIEEQLRLAAEVDDSPDPLDDDTDVVSILKEMGESDPDLSDLGDYLQKSDNNELLDNSILEQMEKAGMEEEEDAGEEEGSSKKKKKKEKKEKGEGGLFGLFKKKKKAEESSENTEGTGEKKPGFFARLLQILTAEPEEEEEVPEGKQTKLSDENEAILKEIDAEGDDPKGKKKKKKEKKKKPKKEKAEKPKKEKKPKKPKKEKTEEPDNSKKIPKKYIIRTFMLSLSILAAILVLSMYVPSLLVLKQARNAYYDSDYKTAFLQMYGKDLSESDRLIYERSRLLVTLDRKYESYENYRKMGMRAEALDALLQGVKRYEEMKDEAKELNVAPEFGEIYIKIIAALNGDFDMTEDEARETLTYSPFDYTGKIHATANGEPYRLMQDEVNETILQPVLDELQNHPENFIPEVLPEVIEETPEPEITPELPDLLPEEQQYLEQGNMPETTQEESVILEIPVQTNNTAVGNATSNGANIDLQIESGQF